MRVPLSREPICLPGAALPKLPSDRGSMDEVTRLRATLTAGGAVALLLVVAAAAGVAGGTAGGAGGSGTAGAVSGSLGGPSWAESIVLATITGGGVWLIYSLLPNAFFRRGKRSSDRRPWWYWPAVIGSTLAGAAAFTALMLWLVRGKHPITAPTGAFGVKLPRAAFPRLSGVGAGQGGGRTSWLPIALGALVAVLGIVAYRILRRRQYGSRVLMAAPQRDLAEQRRQAVEVIDESLDALEAEPDPRKAVIAAYARMDRWLARAGFGREAWEAPFEHLDRIVVGLGATTAVGSTLAGLFERAKFDYRPCGPEMKQEAISALVQLRDELATIDPPPSTSGGRSGARVAAGTGRNPAGPRSNPAGAV